MSLAHSVTTPIEPIDSLDSLDVLEPLQTPRRPTERHLRSVVAPAKRRKPRVAYAMTAIVGLLLIGIAQMGLSLATTATAYELSDLAVQQHDLRMQTQVLNEEITGLASPQYLAANADAAGLVVGGAPTYLRLSDGAIIGSREVAGASTVNALKTPAVPNSLIANTPLATAPNSTMNGAIPVAVAPVAAENLNAAVPVAPEPELPPAITDGIPTPDTH